MFHYTLSSVSVAKWPPFGKVSEYQISQGVFEKLIKNHRKSGNLRMFYQKKTSFLTGFRKRIISINCRQFVGRNITFFQSLLELFL